MLAQLQRNVDLALADDVVRHPQIVEIGIFEHLDPLLHRPKRRTPPNVGAR